MTDCQYILVLKRSREFPWLTNLGVKLLVLPLPALSLVGFSVWRLAGHVLRAFLWTMSDGPRTEDEGTLKGTRIRFRLQSEGANEMSFCGPITLFCISTSIVICFEYIRQIKIDTKRKTIKYITDCTTIVKKDCTGDLFHVL